MAPPGTSQDRVTSGDESGIRGLSLTKTLNVVEAGHRDSEHRPLLYVLAGQGVRHGIGGARLVFHREVEAEELAHPVILWDGR